MASTTGHTGRAKQYRRTRQGCATCRGRRVKCDESKPECGSCVRLGLACEYETAPRPSARLHSRWKRAKLDDKASPQTADNTLDNGAVNPDLDIDLDWPELQELDGLETVGSSSALGSAEGGISRSPSCSGTDESLLTPEDELILFTPPQAISLDMRAHLPDLSKTELRMLHHFSNTLAYEMDTRHREMTISDVWSWDVMQMAMRPENDFMRHALVAVAAKDVALKRKQRHMHLPEFELTAASDEHEASALQSLSTALVTPGRSHSAEVLTTVVVLSLLSMLHDRGHSTRTHLAAAAHLLQTAPTEILNSPLGRRCMRLFTTIDLTMAPTRNWNTMIHETKTHSADLDRARKIVCEGDRLEAAYHQLAAIISSIDSARLTTDSFLTLATQSFKLRPRERLLELWDDLLDWHVQYGSDPPFQIVHRIPRPTEDSPVDGLIYASPRAAVIMAQWLDSVLTVYQSFNRSHLTTVLRENCITGIFGIVVGALASTDVKYRDTIMCLDGTMGIYHPLTHTTYQCGDRRWRWVRDVLRNAIHNNHASAIDLVDPRHIQVYEASASFLLEFFRGQIWRMMCWIVSDHGVHEDFPINEVTDMEGALEYGSPGIQDMIVYTTNLDTVKVLVTTTKARADCGFDVTHDEELTAHWQAKLDAKGAKHQVWASRDDHDGTLDRRLIARGLTHLLVMIE